MFWCGAGADAGRYTWCSQCSQGTDWMLPQAMPDAGVLVNNVGSNFTGKLNGEIPKYLDSTKVQDMFPH